jgi:predicted lipoprotein with Yx(FWY)xxD motif
MGTDRHRPVGNVTMHREPGSAQPVNRWPRLALRVAGGGLLVATAAIHLDLYLTGYRSIPTIGWLFLLQVIAGFTLGLAVLASGSRLAAAAGAGFALATLGGYLLSLWVGLFGFTEVRTTAGIVAGVIEVAAAAALGMLALTPAPGRHAAGAGTGVSARLRAGVPHAGWLVAGISVVALVVLGGSAAAAGGGGPAYAGGGLRTAQIGGANVLVNAKGFTLYWFAPDTPTRSACNGSCTDYWKPLKGPATLSAGVTGTMATIKRSDGTVQATFDGHPLYTYVSDTAPGQASGNGTNLDGGVWHEVTVP